MIYGLNFGAAEPPPGLARKITWKGRKARLIGACTLFRERAEMQLAAERPGRELVWFELQGAKTESGKWYTLYEYL